MLELGRHKTVKNLCTYRAWNSMVCLYESGQVMTEERLGYLDHLNVRSLILKVRDYVECYCKSYAVEFGCPLL